MSLWQSIADQLRGEIAGGKWPSGTRLPPEAELAARFGVNRHTVRHATRVLADEGLLYSRRGAGVFVAASPVDYPLSERVRFHRNIELSGALAMKASDGATFTADKGRYIAKDRKIFAAGSIRATKDDYVLTANELETDDKFETITVKGNARIVKGGSTQ